MKIIGVTIQNDIDNGIELDRITPVGHRLAKSFETVIKDTRYYKEWRHRNEPIPKEVLIEYGNIAGLSRLKQPNAHDLPILTDLFLPSSTDDKLEKLRYESLNYYMHIVKTCQGKPLDKAAWRYMMYDVFSIKGKGQQIIPGEFQTVSRGWEIYHGRQLFTYSLEAMWFYILKLMAGHVYTKSELISCIFDELRKSDVDINKKTIELLKFVPLEYENREKYIKAMGVDDSNVVDNVWNSLLVMLDVYNRLYNRADFNGLHTELLNIGGRDHISLKVWEDKVNEFLQLKGSDLLEYILHYFILEQHKRVALDKILTAGNETYHFIEEEGKLFFVDMDIPTFNVFRVDQGLSVLQDLGLLKRQGNIWFCCQANGGVLNG